MANKYVWHGKISEAKFRQLLKLFCLDLSGGQIAKLINLSRNTVNKYGKALRGRMTVLCEQEYRGNGEEPAPPPEDLPGAAHSGNGEAGPLIIGITGDGPRVHALLLNGVPVDQNVWAGQVDMSASPPVLKLGQETGAVIAIKGFWGFAKGRLLPVRRYGREVLSGHLGECEFRYNHPENTGYTLLLDSLEQDPLRLS